MSERPTHLSPSSASAFSSCPQRWRFKYIDRQREPAGSAALVGTFAHRVLELLCGFPPEERTQGNAKSIARAEWDDFVADEDDFAALCLDDEQSRAFRWQAWLAIAGLWQLEDPAEVDVVSTEQKVVVDLGPVPFIGIVDRVDRSGGKLIVTDYKSGKLPKPRFRGDKIQQVMLYAAALRASTGELPDRARLVYLGQRVLDIQVTDRRVDEAVGELGNIWSQIEQACSTEQFSPNPSVLCGWCPFIDQCEAGKTEVSRRQEAGTLPAHAPAAANFDLEVGVELQMA